ncbi:MAG: hypothetical protein Q9164_001497 [Protoblastenia rupestris]
MDDYARARHDRFLYKPWAGRDEDLFLEQLRDPSRFDRDDAPEGYSNPYRGEIPYYPSELFHLDTWLTDEEFAAIFDVIERYCHKFEYMEYRYYMLNVPHVKRDEALPPGQTYLSEEVRQYFEEHHLPLQDGERPQLSWTRYEMDYTMKWFQDYQNRLVRMVSTARGNCGFPVN